MCQRCTYSSQYSSSSCGRSCRKKCCRKSKKSKCCKPSCCSRPFCYPQTCCPQYYPCIRTKCGFYTVMLSVTASQTTYEIDNTIRYSYTIINTGSEPICHPVTIQTDKLGTTTISVGYLAPGASYTSSNLFDHQITSTDVSNQSYTIVSTALVQIECNKTLASPAVSTTVNSAN